MSLMTKPDEYWLNKLFNNGSIAFPYIDADVIGWPKLPEKYTHLIGKNVWVKNPIFSNAFITQFSNGTINDDLTFSITMDSIHPSNVVACDKYNEEDTGKNRYHIEWLGNQLRSRIVFDMADPYVALVCIAGFSFNWHKEWNSSFDLYGKEFIIDDVTKLQFMATMRDSSLSIQGILDVIAG